MSIVPSVCLLIDVPEKIDSALWKNPVESIMSMVNLSLQSVGLMIQQTGKEFETIVSKCNSMQQLRQAAKSKLKLKQKLAKA